MKTLSEIAMLGNGLLIAKVSMPKVIESTAAIKAAKRGLADYQKGVLSEEEYRKFLKDAMAYINKSEDEIIHSMEAKGRSL